MDEYKNVRSKLTKAQWIGVITALFFNSIAFLLYDGNLSISVPEQYYYSFLIVTSITIYVFMANFAEFLAILRTPDQERKNYFREDLLLSAWFIVGIVIWLTVNLIAHFVRIDIGGWENVILCLSIIILTVILPSDQRRRGHQKSAA